MSSNTFSDSFSHIRYAVSSDICSYILQKDYLAYLWQFFDIYSDYIYPYMYDIASDTYPGIILTQLLAYFLTVSLTYLLAYDNFCAMAMTNLLNYWYPAFSHIFWHMTIQIFLWLISTYLTNLLTGPRNPRVSRGHPRPLVTCWGPIHRRHGPYSTTFHMKFPKGRCSLICFYWPNPYMPYVHTFIHIHRCSP
jgi:hypothetical protein